MRNFCTLILAFLLAGCGSENQKSASTGETDQATSSSNDVDAPPSPSPLPDHNYVRRERDIYYYTGAISSDAADAGQASSEVYAFRYLGINYVKGNDAVLGMDSRGMPTVTAWCARPCEIIHMSTGQMISYDPHSIIGAVFQDIMDGKLDKPQVNFTPAYRASPPQVLQHSSIYQESKNNGESEESEQNPQGG